MCSFKAHVPLLSLDSHRAGRTMKTNKADGALRSHGSTRSVDIQTRSPLHASMPSLSLDPLQPLQAVCPGKARQTCRSLPARRPLLTGWADLAAHPGLAASSLPPFGSLKALGPHMAHPSSRSHQPRHAPGAHEAHGAPGTDGPRLAEEDLDG